ncbi:MULTISPECIES: hemerythrin domain-containing protein [Rhodococcus]|uniref:hemerythrin domain-containing protein n=1 Tax=Rhodococcus TaxID=1827 RepID=UPI001E5AE41C|nr:hemerythrin domain-containing protein [Rhodococcus pyridinivorans]MCD2119148.1 hemerythrin domain-containing protein [Rhodococcus pyridinivorans]MCZ4628033.1 hemerythrin domain-containing protein [Rhodococcus pyridinivorans]MCZ4649215.1 hemerythrin domain-containing protein [Rhodococcus pyridinivorans]MDJ0484413.1 hemerythrin domain-containing protein [Rhodococcus pyridinivorans]MDV7255348.1 hemerythrin domain-containing protein [Rhodococcus pyridinivorans]
MTETAHEGPNSGGTEAVEHDKEEHYEIVQVMKQLEGAEASSAEFTTLVKKLQDLLRHHANDEESDQFPALRTHLGRTPSWRSAPRYRPPRSWPRPGRIRPRRIPNCSIRPSDRGSAWWTDCATH